MTEFRPGDRVWVEFEGTVTDRCLHDEVKVQADGAGYNQYVPRDVVTRITPPMPDELGTVLWCICRSECGMFYARLTDEWVSANGRVYSSTAYISSLWERGDLSIARPGPSVGDHVSAGDYLGKAGSTGNSSGPRMHFEARP